MGRTCSIHGRDEKWCTKFWLENLRGRDHSGDLGTDGNMILEWMLGKQGGKMWTGFIWLRTETSV